MLAQPHTAAVPVPVPVAVQGDSPTPLPLHPSLHALALAQSQSQSQSQSQASSPGTAPTLQHLTGEVLATARLLQQQIRTLECLAHATEEREATLAQQRAKLQDLLRLVTHMETAEARATAALRDSLARVRAGRDRGAGALAALRLSEGANASPEASPPGAATRLRGGGGSGGGGRGGRGGRGGGGGDAETASNADPGSASVSPKKGPEAEACEGGHDIDGGDERGGQPRGGEGHGVGTDGDGASKQNLKQGGSLGGDGEPKGEDASQPLPQFSSLRVKTEDEEPPQRAQTRGAPQEEDVGAPLLQTNPVASPGTGTGASEPRVADRDHGGDKRRARAKSEHDAGVVQVNGSNCKEAQTAGGGRGASDTAASRQVDRRPTSAPGGAPSPQTGSPASSRFRQGDEPTDVSCTLKAAPGSDGSWRARKRMPGRKEQTKCAVADGQEGARGRGGEGGEGDSDGQAGGHQKRGGQRTPSPKKAPVPGDRVQPSPPKKAGKSKGAVAQRN